jgi:hypothetical protein
MTTAPGRPPSPPCTPADESTAQMPPISVAHVRPKWKELCIVSPLIAELTQQLALPVAEPNLPDDWKPRIGAEREAALRARAREPR